MKVQWTEVTWYSRMSTIVVLLLCVPTLSFYIGKSFQDVLNITQDPVVYLDTTTSNWSKLALTEDELNQLFKAVRRYIKDDADSLLYSDLIIDKKNKNWILVNINPQIENDFPSTQIYMKKDDGGQWKVEGVNDVQTKPCKEYPELEC